MGTIIKDKNFLEIYLSSEKPYKFDINSGVVYGIRGNPIHTVPVGLTDTILLHKDRSNVLKLFGEIVRRMDLRHLFKELITYKQHFIMADRLDAIGYEARTRDLLSGGLMEYIEQNFASFANAYKEDPSLTINSFKEKYAYDIFLKECGIVFPEHCPDIFKDFIKDYWYNAYDDRYKEYAKKYGKWIVYYCLNGGLFTTFSNWEYRNDELVAGCLMTFFNYCEQLHREPEKGNFLKLYTQYCETAFLEKNRIEKEQVAKIYSKYEDILKFETDDLLVVIPTSAEDFLAEANQQNNCVYRCYYTEMLKGNTLIVFIRKKADPTKSYITCEIHYNGSIGQFYYKNNEYAKDNEFYTLYQNHLNENWHKQKN